MKRTASCIATVVVCALTANAGQLKKVVVIKPAPYAPILTGTLTNPGWREATVFTNFYTVKPEAGHRPSERTSAYFMYDKDNVYVGLRMFDSHPLPGKEVLNDKDDWVSVSFDPTDDHKSKSLFGVHLNGSREDFKADSYGPLPGWNGNWTDMSKRVPGGWIAELRIPFSRITKPWKKEITMRLKITRFISRTGEEITGPAPFSGGTLEIADWQRIQFKEK